MTFMRLFLAGLAAAFLVACADRDGSGGGGRADARAASLDAPSPIDAPFRLTNAEAVDAESLLQLLPENLRPQFATAAFDEELGALVLTDITPGAAVLDLLDAEGLTIERAEFYGVDRQALELLTAAPEDGEAGVDAGAFERVFEKVRLFGVRAPDLSASNLSTDEIAGGATLGAMEIDRLSIRRGALASRPEAESDARAVARFFNAFTVAGVYFKDLEIGEAQNTEQSGGDDAGTGAPSAMFSIGDMRLVGLGGGVADAILAADLAYTLSQDDEALDEVAEAIGPQGEAFIKGPLKNLAAPQSSSGAVKSFEWRDIDLSKLMAFGLSGERPPADARDLIDLGTMRLTDAETFVNGRRFSFAPETTVSAMEFEWLAPSKVRAEARDAIYDFTAYADEGDAEALAVMRAFGLDSVSADNTFAYDWSADSGEARLESLFDADGFGGADFALDLDGLTLEAIEAARTTGAEDPVGETGRLVSMDLVLRDEKFLDAVYGLAALQAGGDPIDMRKSLPALVRLAGMQLTFLNGRFLGYVNATADFLEEGGELKVRAAPARPVGFADLRDVSPKSLPDVLNIKVTHTDAAQE